MNENDNDIGNLIRSAGRRRQIPEDELAALEATARGAWNEMVTAERRRKGRQRAALAIAATLLIAALGAWWWGTNLDVSDGTVEQIATLELSVGWVEADDIEILAGEDLSSTPRQEPVEARRGRHERDSQPQRIRRQEHGAVHHRRLEARIE